MGTYAHIPPHVEEHVCTELGLEPEPAATQVVARDRHAEFLSTGAGRRLAGAFATEYAICSAARSARPVSRSAPGRRVVGDAAQAEPHRLRAYGRARPAAPGYAQVGLENVALWHERDISHSSAERVAIPDACLALDYALVTFTKTVERLEIDAARMAANLEATRDSSTASRCC